MPKLSIPVPPFPARWSVTPDETSPASLAFPASWVRCWWCGKIVPYGSPEIAPVTRGKDVVYMHAKCQHEAEVAEWSKEPPMHGGD